MTIKVDAYLTKTGSEEELCITGEGWTIGEDVQRTFNERSGLARSDLWIAFAFARDGVMEACEITQDFDFDGVRVEFNDLACVTIAVPTLESMQNPVLSVFAQSDSEEASQMADELRVIIEDQLDLELAVAH